MDERSRVLMATFMGTVVGSVWGWRQTSQYDEDAIALWEFAPLGTEVVVV